MIGLDQEVIEKYGKCIDESLIDLLSYNNYIDRVKIGNKLKEEEKVTIYLYLEGMISELLQLKQKGYYRHECNTLIKSFIYHHFDWPEEYTNSYPNKTNKTLDNIAHMIDNYFKLGTETIQATNKESSLDSIFKKIFNGAIPEYTESAVLEKARIKREAEKQERTKEDIEQENKALKYRLQEEERYRANRERDYNWIFIIIILGILFGFITIN